MFHAYAEITIVGGGIIGTSMAYYLAKKGRDVALVERNYLASEASGANGGLLDANGSLPYADHDKYRYGQIAEQGRAIYSRLADELGRDVEYRQPGGLTLVRPQELEVFDKIMDGYRKEGLNFKFLSPQEVRQMEPDLTGEIGGALFFPDIAHINPHYVVQAYGEAAQAKHKLKIYPHTEVRGIRLLERKVQAVETDRGTIATKMVINAAGSWSAQIGAMVGCHVPVIPRRGQVFVLQAMPPRLKHCIGVAESNIARTDLKTLEEHDTPDHPTVVDGRVRYRVLYGRQTAGGHIVFGGRSEFVGLNKQVTPKGIGSVMAHVLGFFPGFKDLLVIRTWAGVIPYSLDGKPILGPVPDVDGFYLATGLCGGGFCIGAPLGQMMANLINHGQRPGLFDDSSITRFARS